MSVISKKNPVLSEVSVEFDRYASDPKKREFERRRMMDEAFHRIEIDAEIERAIAESEARGEIRGEIRGEAKDAAKKVAHLLGRRFEKISRKLTEALLRIDDLDKLDKLFDLAFDCTSLEDFKKKMN